jgi:hypothetical protein
MGPGVGLVLAVARLSGVVVLVLAVVRLPVVVVDGVGLEVPPGAEETDGPAEATEEVESDAAGGAG